MTVLLFQVGRNLNRAYRTCASFGVSRIALLDCAGAAVSGRTFGANGRVSVETVDEWPDMGTALALETGTGATIESVDWESVRHLFIGGESRGLPHHVVTTAGQRATIPTRGWECLTVEAALAVALYARQVTLHGR